MQSRCQHRIRNRLEMTKPRKWIHRFLQKDTSKAGNRETTKTAVRLRNFCHLLIRFIPQDEPLLASRSARTEEFIGLSCRYAACHAELLCRWCRFEGPSRQDVLRTGTDTETTEIDHVTGTWSQLNQRQQDAPKSKLLEEATHFQDGKTQRLRHGITMHNIQIDKRHKV